MLPIQKSLHAIANPARAKISAGFFKTGVGQYGEGDRFLGIAVPDTRKLVKQHLGEMDFEGVHTLLQSPYHEERLAGVVTLVEWAKRKTYNIRELAEFYLTHVDRINNWDLVDVSAPDIVGPYISECLTPNERTKFIDECVISSHLWTNRIIVLASFHEIRKGDAEVIFSLAPRFFTHSHDLMHKACGWMLREAGKRAGEAKLSEFLDIHSTQMPRTMLRYSIERFDAGKREHYMNRR